MPLQTENLTRAAPAQIPISCPYTQQEITQAWAKCAHTVQDHCDQMVARWKEEIDMFLVFAGLFSAVVTSFNVQSYAMLQQDNSDTTAQALVQISAQLSGLTMSMVNPGTSTNLTIPKFQPDQNVVPKAAVWINTLWFSSLVCTVSAASVAIVVKQWLQQYNLGLSGNSHEVARLRQYRYESLLKWHVGSIIAFLPILLQIALALFLAGLTILMWTLHPVVAGVASFCVAIVLAFMLSTTLLPTFYPDCFYQAPQALGFFLVVQGVRRLLNKDKKSYFRNWHSREKTEVREKLVDLDRGLAAKTYGITLDEATLNDTVVTCMWDLPSERLTLFLEDILRTSNRREPVVPCILHYMTLAAKNPEPHREMVRKLLGEARWPRMEANSETGELFVRTMATLVSRGVERSYAFYRLSQTLACSALDAGIRIKPELVEYIVSVLPNPSTGREVARLIRSRDPRGLPLVYSYLQVLPRLIGYFAHLVVESPHEQERVQLQIDTMLDTLQTLLMHVAWTEDASNLSTVLWALRRSEHISQMVKLKTDAKCSPLIPPDIVESYQDVLATIQEAATGNAFQTYFKRHLTKFSGSGLGGREPMTLVRKLHDDLDVLARLFWLLPWQNNKRRRPSGSNAETSHPLFTPGFVQTAASPPGTATLESPRHAKPEYGSQASSATLAPRISSEHSKSSDTKQSDADPTQSKPRTPTATPPPASEADLLVTTATEGDSNEHSYAQDAQRTDTASVEKLSQPPTARARMRLRLAQAQSSSSDGRLTPFRFPMPAPAPALAFVSDPTPSSSALISPEPIVAGTDESFLTDVETAFSSHFRFDSGLLSPTGSARSDREAALSDSESSPFLSRSDGSWRAAADVDASRLV